MNINKWLNENTESLKGKTVLFIGATGSTGFEALKTIASLNAEIIVGARNEKKALSVIDNIKNLYPLCVINYLLVNISSVKSIDSFIENLKVNNIKIDIFINNAGVYHIPPVKSKDGIDLTLETNMVGSIYLTEKIIPFISHGGTIEVTSSISYYFYKPNYSHLDISDIKGKMKKYGLSKREMMESFIYLKTHTERHDIQFNIVHPGICATELFIKGHSRFFMHFIFPLMKLIFHNPLKASLSIIKGIYVSTNADEWIGPKGLFHVWGYPEVYKIRKCALKNNKSVYDYYSDVLNNIS